MALKTFVRALAAATAYYLVPITANAAVGYVRPPLATGLQKIRFYWHRRGWVRVDPRTGEILHD
jgi:hypothetical protein